MASGSPTVHSRLKAAHSPMMHSRHFVEDSPRTRIELARNNLIMQKEIMKIEKQAKTAAINLSNNQQALRMSLRQIEGKHNSDFSPLLTRSNIMDKNESTPSKRKLGLFANNTCLTVESTAEAYQKTDRVVMGGRVRSKSTSGHQLARTELPIAGIGGGNSEVDVAITHTDASDDNGVFPDTASTQFNATDQQSPYISTPLNVRRVVRSKLSKPFHSLAASQHLPVTAVKHRWPQELSQSCHTIRSLDKSCNAATEGSDNCLQDIKMPLKLPPINATRTVISAHHNTTDKATLKKASQLLGMSSVSTTRSDGPTSFQQFYKDTGSSLIIVSPPATPCGERDDIEQSFDSDDDNEQTKDESGHNVDSTASLSEMFEQIKKCRYIRHYYPNGEKPPEAWY